MTNDPRSALNRLIAAFEAHLDAAVTGDEESPAVVAAENALQDAFFTYDDALFTAYGIELPFDIVDSEGDEDDDLGEDDYDDDEWVAFSYDASTGIFAMYNAASGDEPYAYRKFSADYSRMENQGMSSGNRSGVFVRNASGIYSGDSVDIYKYITDGLLLFLRNR